MSVAALTFDRIAYIDRLTSGGIDEQQARAHAAALEIALSEGVATKADVAGLGRELRSEMAALRSEIQDVRREIHELETRLEAKIETAIASVKVEILRWLIVTQVGLGGFIFAALKLAH